MSSEPISKTKTVEYKWGDDDDQTMSVEFSAQEIDDLLNTTLTSSIGAQGTSGSYMISTGANGTNWNTSPYIFNTYSTANIGSSTTAAGLHVTSDAEFDGDIKWKGRSLGELLITIEKRLAILTPDPAKLEHFESLQKAYQHYKTLEALCELPNKKEEK